MKAYRTYARQGWVTYDIAYHRHAANAKSLDWGVIDFNLYNETFAGWVKAIPRCKFCSSELHSSNNCDHAYSLVQFNVQSSNRRFPSKLPNQATPICFKFNSDNQNNCKLKWCRYAHICLECQGRHPKSSCPLRRSNSSAQRQSQSQYPAGRQN